MLIFPIFLLLLHDYFKKRRQQYNQILSMKELIYGLNDRPPLKESVFAGFQHLMAILVAIATPPLIISGALNFDTATTAFLVSMAFFASGIATFIQCRRFGPVGTGMLCIEGTSFSFIGPIIAVGAIGGLPMIFGCCIVAALVEIIISRLLKYARKIITPLVSGIVVTLIGLTLIKVGVNACGGGTAATSDGTFGSWQNLMLAAIVMLVIIVFQCSHNRYLRMGSIFIGIATGFIVALFMGMVNFSSVDKFPLINFPMPLKYGLQFNLSGIISLGIIFMITAIEAYGDITANSMISGEPVEGDKFMHRAQGGILGDGFNSLLSGLLCAFPNSIFAQNNGMIQLTGVASRYIGYYVAGFLVLLGLFPAVGLGFSLIPSSVLGGATLLMFGMVAAAGIRIISSQHIDRRATLVLALSFSLGLGVELQPDILKTLPPAIGNIFSSGITTGGLTAIITNALVRQRRKD